LNPSHNAYKAKNPTVTVHYQHHYLYGQKLPVWRRQKWEKEELVFCKLKDDTIVTVPTWMTDAAKCTNMNLGKRLVDVSALLELRDFLDKHLAVYRYGDSKLPESAKEKAYEKQIPNDDVQAAESAGSNGTSDEHTREKQRRVDRCTGKAARRPSQKQNQRKGRTK
jgi:hypothetical protein